MGFFDNFFGNGDKTTVTNSGPWDVAQPYLKDVMKSANRLYKNNTGYKPWTGSVLAGITPEMAGSLGGMTDFNNALMTGRGNQAVDTMSGFARGDYNEDPRLAEAIKAREDRAANALSTRFGNGAFGAAALGRNFASGMAEAGNELMLQSNENNRNRQLQAGGILGNWGLQGAQLANTVGNFYQDRAQAERDAKIKVHEAKQARPWEQLGRYSGILGGMGSMGGTRTAVAQDNKSPFQQLMTGAGILGMFA